MWCLKKTVSESNKVHQVFGDLSKLLWKKPQWKRLLKTLVGKEWKEITDMWDITEDVATGLTHGLA